MGAAYFYHLTETPLESTLPGLIARARQAGWRVLVRAPDSDLLDRLDRALWLGAPDSFLPHGLAGGPHDADQPVLLGRDTPATGFACVMSVAGADITAAETAQAERVCILFDGVDPDAVQTAREQWKTLTAAGCAAQYWAQDGGRWIKKAEAGAA